MVMPRGEGLASSGHFWLEIEMISTDSIKQVLMNSRYKRPRVWPADPKQPHMDLIRESRFIKGKVPCGIVRCSKANLGIFKWYIREFKGSGRKFATSLGSGGVL